MKILGVIPARFKSTRLPGKPLADIQGKPMIQWVYESAKKSDRLTELLVATDDERIAEATRGFGGSVVMTDPDLSTRADRVAQVARNRSDDILVNIQGGEPFLDPAMIDEIVDPLISDPSLSMCTSLHEVLREEDFADPNVVKVVCDLEGYGLYFSRSLIPYPRTHVDFRVFEHIGLYAYRREFLLDMAGWPQTPLEKLESLEQLRVLEHGVPLKVVETGCSYVALSVDTPEDLETARAHAARIIRGGRS